MFRQSTQRAVTHYPTASWTAPGLAAFFLLAACAQLSPLPPGGPAFGVLGDTPYSEAEIERLDALIEEINAQPLAFVVHVGDIGTSNQACSQEWTEDRKRQFARIRHPFVLLPGDNEWSDCKQPLERLREWRRLFCHTTLKVEVQKGAYCEHVRWEAGGLVFVALNVPGSNNNVRHAEHGPRMQAALAWLDEAAALAAEKKGLVVLMQANPFITLPRDGFGELRKRLEGLASASPGKIFLIHGDTHVYRDDEPLPGLRRIEVWGSPIVSWLRVALVAGALRIDAVR